MMGANEKAAATYHPTGWQHTTGAKLVRERVAFTSKDMSAEFVDAFIYAVVCGWDDDDPNEESAMAEVAERHGWDEDLIAFLRDTNRRFEALIDKAKGSLTMRHAHELSPGEHIDPHLEPDPAEVESTMQTWTFPTTVTAETYEQAVQVMQERVMYDEDYGFDYEVSYTSPPAGWGVPADKEA